MWEWLFTTAGAAGGGFHGRDAVAGSRRTRFTGARRCLFGFSIRDWSMGRGPASGLHGGSCAGIPYRWRRRAVGKALEIVVILRFSPRTRGAMVGFMSWLGYASMMMFLLLGTFVPAEDNHRGPLGSSWNPSPSRPGRGWGCSSGRGPDGSFSVPAGHGSPAGPRLESPWRAAVVVQHLGRATRGLSGNFGNADTGARQPPKKRWRKLRRKEPLYPAREFLWFIRDRSAIVQTILIPLLVGRFSDV